MGIFKGTCISMPLVTVFNLHQSEKPCSTDFHLVYVSLWLVRSSTLLQYESHNCSWSIYWVADWGQERGGGCQRQAYGAMHVFLWEFLSSVPLSAGMFPCWFFYPISIGTFPWCCAELFSSSLSFASVLGIFYCLAPTYIYIFFSFQSWLLYIF